MTDTPGEAPFRLRRYHAPGAANSTIVATLTLPATDAAELNRLLVKTAYRLWPAPKETP